MDKISFYKYFMVHYDYHNGKILLGFVFFLGGRGEGGGGVGGQITASFTCDHDKMASLIIDPFQSERNLHPHLYITRPPIQLLHRKAQLGGTSVVVDFLFIVTPIVGVCNCSMFCTLLYVHSSIAIILIALLNLSSCCLVMVERLFLTVPRGCLQFVIVVFPDHTHLLFFLLCRSGIRCVFSCFVINYSHFKRCFKHRRMLFDGPMS